MTGRIIQLPGDRHREIRALLPWYAKGLLDPSETAQVKAHLSECAECQAELRDEYQLAAEIADLPGGERSLDVERGWNAIRRQIDQESQGRASFREWVARVFEKVRSVPAPRSEAAWLRWAVAGQFCLLLVMGVAVWRTDEPARYHALGAAPASAAANVVVVFGPETPERELRAIIRSNDARLVDGPTVADAYLLHVPPAGRAAALTRLRARKQVVLAEPIDAGENP
jgi:anti-sigma factor RsiW